MHANTVPTLQAALHMLRAQLSETDRIRGARTWLNMPRGEKPGPEEWEKIVELRGLMDARLRHESTTTAEEFAKMIERLIGG